MMDYLIQASLQMNLKLDKMCKNRRIAPLSKIVFVAFVMRVMNLLFICDFTVKLKHLYLMEREVSRISSLFTLNQGFPT